MLNLIIGTQYRNFSFNYLVVFFCLILTYSCPFSIWSYEVFFKGIEEDSKVLEVILASSQLEKLKDSPPNTMLAFKRRAENDIENIILALHSQAYYDAHVDFHIENSESVIVNIQTGPIYPIASFNIRYFQNGEEVCDENFLHCVRLKDLSINIGDPALPETILNAEDHLLDQLNFEGYALAYIKKRDVFADQEAKNVIVWMQVEIGPLSYFGPLSIKGTERVNESFFTKKLRWTPGERYNPKSIEETQEALELSGLFRSVNITYDKDKIDGNLLPMEISVHEGKQRTLGFGLSYMTSWGPGISTDWEDRNIFGNGEKLSFRSDISQKLQEGSLTYLIPDFKQQNQNLIYSADFIRKRTKSFIENNFSISATIERKINDRLRFSYGGMYKRLRSQRSDFNGTFDLLKVPFQLRWSTIDSILEPTTGVTFQFKTIPSLQITAPYFAYVINTFTGTSYFSLTKDKRHVFASKFMIGSIVGATKHEIPPPERFYAGSDSTLRGYRFETVSPLKNEKPIGGRSMLIYSLELRNRIGENFGLVWFYDVGNVYGDSIPNLKEGLLQSVGLGIRYYTPIGPLRLDIAFPLNKRCIDHSLEAYFSIGQSF